ncbi:MAG TPA: ImmA/IrrE family metallo-endopeptidase [Oligoflexus sp.]|uniref:ImmA/IrrE family metallo-endopeptidase n=1 Tax=Oligoflexus sp. TaxID=1971216 RepID=UPI002D2D64B4|nr:ImmA/IrrE family metallo-endopeptidase [Oligoflexus sp.]HYX35557.1 ImmA/IrrE family metallo-endopeptidase [Oligoflexus sp.]
MKKVEANRYPHSATLFRFCKEALEIRYDGNVKVIDQDVGAILGYDPADCSHWKKGKKNIRSLSTLRSIADHLNVDESLLIDITSGKVSLDEAVFEFRGYGQFTLSGKPLESLKKEYFKNPGKWQSSGQTSAFEEVFDIQRYAVVRLAEDIIHNGGFTEAPIYIPEILRMFPAIQLATRVEQEEPFTVRHEGEGRDLKSTIVSRESETRPYIRFIAAKTLFKHLVASQYPDTGMFANSPAEILDIQSNIFAGALLVPGDMLRREVDRIDTSFDLLRQLADMFWVSRSLMNQRLRDFLEFHN